jgi:DNA-3-methyladenine glycosylase
MGEARRTGKKLSQQLPPVLGPDFFDRNADAVARDLIGKTLVREHAGTRTSYMITETEAYLGEHDLASHSARGRTPRTEVMFGPPGVLYIYLVYGLHWMINVVTGAPGHAAAVLIRSAGPFTGPGRLARGLQISSALNGMQAEPSAGLWFGDAPIATSFRIQAGPRIGVDYAGPVWSRRKLRFVLRGA